MQIINSLIHKIEDRAIHLVVDPSSPLHEIKDALMKFLVHISQVEEFQKSQQKENEKKPVEDVSSEQPKEV